MTSYWAVRLIVQKDGSLLFRKIHSVQTLREVQKDSLQYTSKAQGIWKLVTKKLRS